MVLTFDPCAYFSDCGCPRSTYYVYQFGAIDSLVFLLGRAVEERVGSRKLSHEVSQAFRFWKLFQIEMDSEHTLKIALANTCTRGLLKSTLISDLLWVRGRNAYIVSYGFVT